ncbi:hypothetical protein GGR50DRAFT_704408 [Xylaria sp. CBS 124048]|nr:hypothetical protein GGR50DRAFT_704408 [Xylaria sp. CBS 124048]
MKTFAFLVLAGLLAVANTKVIPLNSVNKTRLRTRSVEAADLLPSDAINTAALVSDTTDLAILPTGTFDVAEVPSGIHHTAALPPHHINFTKVHPDAINTARVPSGVHHTAALPPHYINFTKVHPRAINTAKVPSGIHHTAALPPHHINFTKVRPDAINTARVPSGVHHTAALPPHHINFTKVHPRAVNTKGVPSGVHHTAALPPHHINFTTVQPDGTSTAALPSDTTDLAILPLATVDAAKIPSGLHYTALPPQYNSTTLHPVMVRAAAPTAGRNGTADPVPSPIDIAAAPSYSEPEPVDTKVLAATATTTNIDADTDTDPNRLKSDIIPVKDIGCWADELPIDEILKAKAYLLQFAAINPQLQRGDFHGEWYGNTAVWVCNCKTLMKDHIVSDELNEAHRLITTKCGAFKAGYVYSEKWRKSIAYGTIKALNSSGIRVFQKCPVGCVWDKDGNGSGTYRSITVDRGYPKRS